MTRKYFDLDKDWRFHNGDLPYEIGTDHTAVYRSAKAGNIGGPADKRMFDTEGWERVDLPHDYLREAEFSPDAVKVHGYRPKTNAWYRKTFTVGSEYEGCHALLVFEGISTEAQIFFNGSLLRRSFSCYTEIAVDITDRIYFDRINTLSVYVKGDATEGWWYEGAGIYRHVHLYMKTGLHIAHNGIWAKPVITDSSSNEWSVDTEICVENSDYDSAPFGIRAWLYEGDTVISSAESESMTAEGDGITKVNISLSVHDPSLWDVDSPNLYTLKTELVTVSGTTDTENTRIGFRTFRIDADKGFYLNGRQLKIKGVCCHQDHAGVGVAVPDSIQRYRIKLLKEMGCNAYRCAHHPHARAILDACDEYGIIVMDENRRFETGDDFIRNWEMTLKRDRNHPSVIFYSLFNEEPLQSNEEGRAIYRRLKSLTLKYDDTRLITGAVNEKLVQNGTGEEMDVFGLNYGLGKLGSIHREFPDKPIIGSENNSAVATRGCYLTDNDAHILSDCDEEIVPWGSTLRNTWKAVRDNDFFSGIFVWTGFDYRGEPTPFDWPSAGSQFGIMDICGFPKNSYYFHKAAFSSEPVMHILPHWDHKAGDTVRVITVTNCDEVELFVNGRSLGRRRSDICEQCEWQVAFEKGTLSAVGYINGEKHAYAERKTAGKPQKIVLVPDRNYIYDDGKDVVPVRVSLADADGNEIPDASNLIDFEIIGDGHCVGVGNGDPNSHEPEHLPHRHLFSGLCQILVGTNTGAKTLKLRATADGLDGDCIDFEVRKTETPDYLPYVENYLLKDITVSPADCPEKPDPTVIYADNDMNSFAPAMVDDGSFTPGFVDGWREYRVPLVIPENEKGKIPTVVFGSLLCASIEVYANGTLLYKGGPFRKKLLSLPLPNDTTIGELRVLLNARHDITGPNGIGGGIRIFFN